MMRKNRLYQLASLLFIAMHLLLMQPVAHASVQLPKKRGEEKPITKAIVNGFRKPFRQLKRKTNPNISLSEKQRKIAAQLGREGYLALQDEILRMNPEKFNKIDDSKTKTYSGRGLVLLPLGVALMIALSRSLVQDAGGFTEVSHTASNASESVKDPALVAKAQSMVAALLRHPNDFVEGRKIFAETVQILNMTSQKDLALFTNPFDQFPVYDLQQRLAAASPEDKDHVMRHLDSLPKDPTKLWGYLYAADNADHTSLKKLLKDLKPEQIEKHVTWAVYAFLEKISAFGAAREGTLELFKGNGVPDPMLQLMTAPVDFKEVAANDPTLASQVNKGIETFAQIAKGISLGEKEIDHIASLLQKGEANEAIAIVKKEVSEMTGKDASLYQAAWKGAMDDWRQMIGMLSGLDHLANGRSLDFKVSQGNVHELVNHIEKVTGGLPSIAFNKEEPPETGLGLTEPQQKNQF